MDLGGDYRDLYVKRVQNLEKVKRKLQQFPSLSVESLTESIAVHPAVYQLQNAMVGLMEHDVTLMRQLISLQESVEQLKSYRQQPQLSPAGSTQSLSEDLDSLSLAGDSVSGQRQYFSRQNSILRIPIPPRRDVKLRTIVDDPDETSSGVSSSDGTFKPEKSVRPKSLVISTDSDCHSRQSSGDTPNSPESSQPRPIRLKNSFDSGIHLSQDVVYV